jgi:hypothetical protein
MNSKSVNRRLALAFAMVLLPSLSILANANEKFPERPITIVVPAAPGGGTDASARIIAKYLTEQLGQSVAVLNRPGAAGIVALNHVKGVPADGYVAHYSTGFILANHLIGLSKESWMLALVMLINRAGSMVLPFLGVYMTDHLKFSIEKFYVMTDEHRLLTFGQQIARAVQALEDPEIHATVANNIKHLIVDEYQDVNPAQERLIELLAKPKGSADLVVVGDDDQAIYQWRGSTVENITTFAKRYKKVMVTFLKFLMVTVTLSATDFFK